MIFALPAETTKCCVINITVKQIHDIKDDDAFNWLETTATTALVK